MWIISGALSVVSTLLNWAFVRQDGKKSYGAGLCAVSFAAMTVLMEYRLAADWVNREDWAALMDTVPSTFAVLAGYVAAMILLNALPLALKESRRSKS